MTPSEAEMAMDIPDPNDRYPLKGWHGTAYLKAVVNDPKIEVGDFSYYTNGYRL